MTGGGLGDEAPPARLEQVLAHLGPGAEGLAPPAELANLVQRVEDGLFSLDAMFGPVTPDDLDAPLTAPETTPGVTPAPAPGDYRGTGLGTGSPWAWRVDEQAASHPGTVAAGPLGGWRLAVKDLIAVAGRPVTAGSNARSGARAEVADAPVVARLRAAGAELVGGTRLHEFAFGTTGVNATGTPVNPAAPGRVPGGSSSGAAVAVAGGEADLSLGTDTGGSVRIPAALCGVVGFKPSLGALPTDATFPLSPTLDHVGFLVARAERLVAPAQVLGLLGTGEDVRGDLTAPGAPSGRYGVARGWAELVSEPVAVAFAAALDELRTGGIEVVEVDWPGGERVFAATTAIMFAEAARVHRHLLAARAEQYGADVRARLVQGSVIGLDTYLAGRDYRRRAQQACRAVLHGVPAVDGVLSPTVPLVAPLLEEAADPAVAGRLVTFTRLADLTGLPAVSIPLPGQPLPVGLQVETGTDRMAIRAAIALERALGG